MPKPLLAHIRAQSRVWASGLALTLVEHCVSTMATLLQSSAATKAGKRSARAAIRTVRFMRDLRGLGLILRNALDEDRRWRLCEVPESFGGAARYGFQHRFAGLGELG